MKEQKYGLVYPQYSEKDFVLGAVGDVPQEVLVPNGQWDFFLPTFEYQRKKIETCNCSGFATCHAIQMYFKAKYDIDVNYSDRFLGNVAGTFPPGNDPMTVAIAARNQGMIEESLLPFGDDITTVEEYYSPKPLPETLLVKGKDWVQKFVLYAEWVWSGYPTVEQKVALIKQALTYSTVTASVYAWEQEGEGFIKPPGTQDNHDIVIFGWKDRWWKVFDTYDKSIKLYSMDADIYFCLRFHIEKREIVQKKISIIQQLIALYQKLIAYLKAQKT